MQKPRGKPRGFVLQAKAHGNCIVDLGHRRVIQFSHALTQSGFIDGAYLLKQYDAVTGKSHTLRIELDVGRQSRLAGLARYRSGNNRWAVFIAGVVLNDQNGSHPALLRAHNGAQVGIIYISALDYTQFNSHSE